MTSLIELLNWFDDKDKDRLDKIFKRGKYAKKNDGEKNDK